MTASDYTIGVLRLTCLPGLGPVLIDRALTAFGSSQAIFTAPTVALERVPGIGPERAARIFAARDQALKAADDELAAAARLGVRIISRADPEYSPLLATVSNPPPLLYLRGTLKPLDADRYPIAMVGSRQCTQYGREQADRFASHLAASGLTIISGGARGIDSVSHTSALRSGGRTIAVLGCGLAHCYPPENAALFDSIADGRGAVVSELPLNTPPNSENFPARNRIISGLSLGIIVIEAGKRSGSLITARMAVEDHGREVFAIPGRVDSTASEGTLELLKSGGAALVTCPGDVLEQLESPARHLHGGTHESRYTPFGSQPTSPDEPDLFAPPHPAANGKAQPQPKPQPKPQTKPQTKSQPKLKSAAAPSPAAGVRTANLSITQKAIIAALDSPLSIDDLLQKIELEPGQVRSDLTMLELKHLVVREGSRFARRA